MVRTSKAAFLDAKRTRRNFMKTQRSVVGLTVLNLFVLMSVVFWANSADSTVRIMEGTVGFPKTVLFRLNDSKGAPNVKIAATEDGSGASLGGESDPTHVQIMARGAKTSLTLVNKGGQMHVIKPEWIVRDNISRLT